MRYAAAKNLEPEEFKRLCGVSFTTFEQMVKVVAAEKVLAKKSGRPSKLSIEDQILMTLQYWREYRTYFRPPAKILEISTQHIIASTFSQSFMSS